MPEEAEQHGRFRLFAQIVSAVVTVVLTIKLGKILINSGWADQIRLATITAEAGALAHSSLLRLGVLLALIYLVVRFARRWKLLAALAPAPAFVSYKVCQSFVTGTSVAATLRGSGTLQSLISEMSYLGSEMHFFFELLGPLLWRDLEFLCGFSLLVYALIHNVPKRFFPIVRSALLVMVCLMFIIAGAELAHYLQTGVPGSGQLLTYFFLTSERGGADWWSLLAAHVDRITIAALCAPFVLGIVGAISSRRFAPAKPSTSCSWAAILVPAVLGLTLSVFHPVLTDVRYARQYDDTFLALRDVFPSSEAGATEAARLAAEQPPLFETSLGVLRPKSPSSRPARNVIVIMMESAQAKATTMYNPGLATTPFLSGFAKRGAIVSDMYAVIPRTQAAWMSILYGIYPSTNDIVDRWPSLPGGQQRFVSLPQLLGERGYATGFITSTDVVLDQAPIQGMGFQWVENGKTLPTHGLKQVNYDGFEDGLMVEPALSWIRTQSTARRPFFLAMMTNVGHDPYSFPSSWQKRSFGTGNPSYENYLNCMAYIDSVLQNFLQGLDHIGVLQNSLVVILGDHGESFGEHGSRQHIMSPYEEALKIPAIIYADGVVPPGSSITGLRQEPDILPTVLDALGLQSEHLIVPGTSLFRPVAPDRKLYYSTSFYDGVLALRTGETKFIYNFDRTPLEVYDIGQDPSEQHNIADKIPEKSRNDAISDMLVWRERVRRALVEDSETAPVPWLLSSRR